MVLKRVFMCTVLAMWMLGLGGCGVNQSDYDAQVSKAKDLADKSAKAESTVAKLQTDFDAT